VKFIRGRRRRDDELEEEIQSHMRMAEQDRIDRGEDPEQARFAVRREFGNVDMVTEVTREMWGWVLLERLGRDMRFGLQSLWKHPGFAITAILIISLGVGANTAVFSVVNELLIRPLPYADAARIVDLASMDRKTGENMLVSASDFKDWHDQSTAFAAMSLYSSSSAPTKAGSAAEYAETTWVSQEFFSVFQQHASRGRLFNDEDFINGNIAKVAIISESYWRNRCGADPHILGRTLRLSSTVLTVVGVLPGEFRFPNKTEIWIPLITRYYKMNHGAHNFQAVGRIKPGFSVETAQSEMSGIATRLERQYPLDNRGMDAKLTRLRDCLVANVRQSLLLLFSAVGTILLIAWVNLAGILLVRTTARTREMATRLALGASRRHLWSQLLAESAAIALPVAALSLFLAYFGRRALLALASKDISQLGSLSLDLPVLAFSAGLSMLTILLVSCVLAWHACRLNPNASLKQTSGRAMGSAGMRRLRALLVVGEIALSVVLLASAGLLIKSFYRLQSVDLGFHPQNILVMTASYPTSSADRREATRFFNRLHAEIESIPGVTAAGGIRSLPGNDAWSSGGYAVDHWPQLGSIAPEMLIKTAYAEVTPGTFHALGVPLIRGREFAESDTYDAPLVAIINQALARHSFSHQDPIGRTILCGMDDRTPQGMRIVGVVGDIHQFGAASPVLPMIYMPNLQHPLFTTKMNILARSTLDPAALAQAMRRKALKLSPDVPVKFTTLEAVQKEHMASARFSALLLGILAALALCLALVGIYGVMAYLVAQRSGEIGVRMALGASISTVFGMVLREGVRLTIFGLVLGLLGAAAATHLLGNLLFEVQPNDPSVYAGISLVLVLVTLAAVSVPAWRATRVDPVVALRLE
jgi:putative ABC transport system permease protein